MGSTLRTQIISLFFFQAEDGIRDYKVTGVQTCALPILPPPNPPFGGYRPITGTILDLLDAQGVEWKDYVSNPFAPSTGIFRGVDPTHSAQIGRASCRERV